MVERYFRDVVQLGRGFDVLIIILFYFLVAEWSGGGNGEYRVRRQLSVSSDSKLLDEGAREDARVIMRPKRPPRPKSEAFLAHDHSNRRTKRFSAFGVSTNFLLNI